MCKSLIISNCYFRCKRIKERFNNCYLECKTCTIKKIWDFLYYHRYQISILFGVILYIADIVTDILVTEELHRENSPYFYTSLGILLFSLIGSALLSLEDTSFKSRVYDQIRIIGDQTTINSEFICNVVIYIKKAIIWMFLDILQFHFLKNNLIALTYNYRTETNIDRDIYINELLDSTKKKLLNKRMKESLLESGPQSLFQLFIILNQSSNKTFNELIYYYLSVKLSLLNLTYTLVSMDHLYLTKFFSAKKKLPSYFSLYIINTAVFRLTEVFSRVGLLACISQIYDGNYIFLFILIDYLCIIILNSIKRFFRYKFENCEFSTVTLPYLKSDFFKSQRLEYVKRICVQSKAYFGLKILLCWKIYKKDSIYNIFAIKKKIEQLKLSFINRYDYETLRNFNNIERDITKYMIDKINFKKKTFEFISVKYLINNIKYLGVYYNPLSRKLFSKDKFVKFQEFFNYYKFNINIPNYEKWWNKISMHFISKYINNLAISIILIYNLLVNTYSNTIMVISISSMSCFILNMISFYFLTKWNNEDEKIREKLMIEPVLNIDFTRLYSCFNCYEKKNKQKEIHEGENTQKEIHERENTSKNDINLLDC